MAQEYASEFFRPVEAHASETQVGLAALRRDVMFTYASHADIVEHGRSHDELRVQWTSGTRLLPDFRGTVRFRIEGDRTRVLVDGSYVPPFGALGTAFDRIVGRLIARASMRDLANRLAAYLTEREAAWRITHVVPVGGGVL